MLNKKVSSLSVPLTFLFAGIGMLMLSQIDSAEGSFYSRIKLMSDIWTNAHLILLVSTVFVIPASICLRNQIIHF